MRRFAIIWLLVLTLAACGGREPLRPQTLKAVVGLAGPQALAIEVRITEIPPGVRIERVAAVDPAGRALAASDLLRSESEIGPGLVSRPSLGVAVTGGSSSGVNPSVALGMSVSGGGQDSPARPCRLPEGGRRLAGRGALQRRGRNAAGADPAGTADRIEARGQAAGPLRLAATVVGRPTSTALLGRQGLDVA